MTTYGMICYSIEKIDSCLRRGYSIQSGLVINPIEQYGTRHIQKKILNNLYDGSHIGCFASIDDNETRAVLKKSHYLVNGSKTMVCCSPIADIFIIWCRDEYDNMIGLVTERKDGLRTDNILMENSICSFPIGTVHMDDLEIPVENKLMVGKINGPAVHFNKAMYGISWGAIGVAEDCLDTASTHYELIGQNRYNKMELAECIILYNDMLNRSMMALNRLNCYEKDIELFNVLKKKNCDDAFKIAKITRNMIGDMILSHQCNIIRHLLNLEVLTRDEYNI